MPNMSVKLTVLISFLLSVDCGLSRAATESALVEEIRKSTLKYVRAIHSIEYEVGETKSSAKATSVRHLKYWQQNNMFRGESSFGGQSGNWVSAYNGKRHQIFFEDTETLSLKDTSTIPNPTRIMGPPLLAFSWLAKSGAVFVWSDLTAEENINDQFLKAEYQESVQINGNHCFALKFPGVLEDSVVIVWFSKEKSYYPIRHVLSKEQIPIAEVEVTSFETVSLEDGHPVFIPTAIRGVNIREAESITTVISPDSLKVNRVYDEALFTIPTTQAKHVNDIDKLEAFGGLRQQYTFPVSAKDEVFWPLVIVNASGLGLLLLYIWRKRTMLRSKSENW